MAAIRIRLIKFFTSRRPPTWLFPGGHQKKGFLDYARTPLHAIQMVLPLDFPLPPSRQPLRYQPHESLGDQVTAAIWTKEIFQLM